MTDAEIRAIRTRAEASLALTLCGLWGLARSERRHVLVAVILLTVSRAAAQVPTPTAFVVDCVDEVGVVVCPPNDTACTCVCWGDMNRDGQITVAEIVTAIANAIHGCPKAPNGSPAGPCWGSATYRNQGVTIMDVMRLTTEALEGCP